jgi:hypothetical protein
MVKYTIKSGLKPVYLQADSWFLCDTFMTEIQKIKIRYIKKLHLIGLMKPNRYIIINGKNKMENLEPDYK